MIFTAVVTLFIAMVSLILSVLPTVPATPTAISSGGTWATDQVAAVISVLNTILTPGLVAATMVIAIGLFTWEWVYGSILWVAKKIPVINIK